MVNVCPQPWIPHVQNLHVSPPPPDGCQALSFYSLHRSLCYTCKLLDQRLSCQSWDHWNFTTMQEISSVLFLLTASSVRRFAEDRASFIFFIQLAASWFDITWNNFIYPHDLKILSLYVSLYLILVFFFFFFLRIIWLMFIKKDERQVF